MATSRVQGVIWFAEYGEISENPLFRIGYNGSQGYEAVLPIPTLADLISVLTNVSGLPVGVTQRGTDYQARKVSAGLFTDIILEPRYDSGTPSQIMRYYEGKQDDLLYVLNLLATELSTLRQGDWDFSELGPILPGSRFDNQLSEAVKDPETEFYKAVQDAATVDAPVRSVNGQEGDIVLGAGDVGAAPDSLVGDVTDLEVLTTSGRLGEEGLAKQVSTAISADTRGRAPVANRFVVIGDSQSIMGDTGAQAQLGDSIVALASLIGGQIDLVANLAVAGENSSSGRARFGDVLAYLPTAVWVRYGSNDVAASITADTTIANLEAMYISAKAAGVGLFITDTLFPIDGATQPQRVLRLTLSERIRVWAAKKPDVICLDAYPDLVDPTTGDFPDSTWTSDGTHLSVKGRLLVARKLVAALGTRLPSARWRVTAVDPTNLLTTDLPSWTKAGTPVPTFADGVAKWSLTSGQSSTITSSTIPLSTDYKGRSLRLSLRVRLSQSTGADRTSPFVGLEADLVFGSTVFRRRAFYVHSDGFVDVNAVVPDGATSVQVILRARSVGAASGVVEAWAPKLVDLTTMGVAPAPSPEPPDTTTALAVVLDPDTLTGTVANGAAITALTSTGGDTAVTLETGVSLPKLKHSGLNGKSVLRFDGAQSVRNGIALSTPFTGSTTLALVLKADAVGVQQMALSGPSSGQYMLVRLAPTGELTAGVSSISQITSVPFQTSGNVWYILVVAFNGASSHIRVSDDVNKSNSTTTAITSVSGLRLGASQADTAFFTGEIAYAQVWRRALTPNDTAGVVDELQARFAL